MLQRPRAQSAAGRPPIATPYLLSVLFFVVIIAGYHVPAIYYLHTGENYSILLIGTKVFDALIYVTAAAITFHIGLAFFFTLSNSIKKRHPSRKKPRPRTFVPLLNTSVPSYNNRTLHAEEVGVLYNHAQVTRISLLTPRRTVSRYTAVAMIGLVAALSVGLLLWAESPLAILWHPVPKGWLVEEGYFTAPEFRQVLGRNIAFLSSFLLTAIAAARLLAWGPLRYRDMTIVLLVVIIAMLPAAYDFSRVVCGPPWLVGVVAFVRPDLRGKFLGLVLAAIGFVSLLAAYTKRGYDVHQGILSFLTAAFDAASHFMRQDSPGCIFCSLETYPFSALEPLTYRMMQREHVNVSVLDSLEKLFFVILPIPSIMLGEDFTVARSLSIELGTWGMTGITTPMLAELYYGFGNIGVVFCAVAGFFHGPIEQRIRQRFDMFSLGLLTLCVAGFGVSLHSEVRASTRPLVWALALLMVQKFGLSVLQKSVNPQRFLPGDRFGGRKGEAVMDRRVGEHARVDTSKCSSGRGNTIGRRSKR